MKQAAVMIIALAAPLLASACAPYEAEPVSVYQWERKVEQVERQEAERLFRHHGAQSGILSPKYITICA